MTGLSARAGGRAQQANFGGDNYAPIIFAGNPAPAPSLHQLPPGIHDFSGRTADIAKVERMIGSPGGGPSVVNVFGAPGIGKSALLVHVAHRLAEKLEEIQLYAELGELDGQVPTSTQVLQRFVAALDPATTGIPVSAQELPARFRSLLSGRRCLVVLDNAQSPDQIADLIPGTAKSAVLVTSRASLAAVQGILPYHLGLMSPAESLELLSSVSRRTWPEGQVPDAAHTLINQCGRLPMALRIVGAILKKKAHWTLEKVAADLAGEQTRLAKLAEGPLDIRSCFEVSYRHLGNEEAQAFRLLSLLPLAQFKLRHAASFLRQSEHYAEDVIEALVDAQLLETDDGRYFRFHDLLRLYARERSQAAHDDPDGARAARFLQELMGEFMHAYTRCIRENKWTVPRPDRISFPSLAWQDTTLQAAPDALYVPTRLTPVGRPAEPECAWHDLLGQHQRILILGAAGTGKTVLADRICYEIAAVPYSSTRFYDVGFAVPLRQRSDHDQNLEMLIADAARSRYGLDLPQETLSTLLRDQKAVVIFDGFDEVPTSSRSQILRDLTAFCTAYPSAKVAVTSRPGPASAAFNVLRFPMYQIAPLTDADIAAFIQSWGKVIVGEPETDAYLLEKISSRKVREDWLSTPLLLTQLLAAYDRTGSVPQQEIELYDMTYAILFESRDYQRGIRRLSPLPSALIGRLVSYLAYELKVRAALRGVSDSEFGFLLEEFSQLSGDDIGNLGDTLAALDLPIRRIPEDTTDREPHWSVTRDPFSEYLAARWILDSRTFSDMTSRLMAIIKIGDFAAGGQFVAQLAARRGHDSAKKIGEYLRDVLGDGSAQLSDSARATIGQILANI